MSKRILFLTTEIPFPPTSGGVQKSWRLLKMMSLHFDVTLASFLKTKDSSIASQLKKAIDLKEVKMIPLNVKRSALTLLRSYIESDSINVYRNYCPEMEEFVESLINDFDLIFVDHYEMYQYVPEKCIAKVIFHEHNAEFALWQRAADFQGSLIKKIILKLEAKRVKKAELRYSANADQIWAAPNDFDQLVRVGADPNKFRVTYHLGNDEMLNLPALKCPKMNLNLLYIGTLSWEPNVDGLCWFLDEVWPDLKTKYSDLKFNIIGKGADIRLISRVSKLTGVELLGFVDDLEDYYTDSRVYLVPLRFGSGIKVKVIDGMYRGIPCVTTSIGAEGLSLKSETEILIKDDPKEYVESIIALLKDDVLWSELSKRSKERARKDYRWDSLLEGHQKMIDDLITN